MAKKKTLSSKYESDRALQEIRRAIDKSTKLGPLRKRILKRRLRRPAVQDQVMDAVVSQCVADGVIVMPSLDDEGNVVAAAWDLDAFIAAIERLLPLIIQIIGLFGG